VAIVTIARPEVPQRGSTVPPRRRWPTRSAPSTRNRRSVVRSSPARVALLRRSRPEGRGGRPRPIASNHTRRPDGRRVMLLSKPVLAAVEGHAVAGGLELPVVQTCGWPRRNAVFGVYCRRWGVPCVTEARVRLPRLVGQSHALDLILTGRPCRAKRPVRWASPTASPIPGGALDEALALAHQLAAFPQVCLCAPTALSAYAAVGNGRRRGPGQRDPPRPRRHPVG